MVGVVVNVVVRVVVVGEVVWDDVIVLVGVVVADLVCVVVGVVTSHSLKRPCDHALTMAFSVAAVFWHAFGSYSSPPNAQSMFSASPCGPRNSLIAAFIAAAVCVQLAVLSASASMFGRLASHATVALPKPALLAHTSKTALSSSTWRSHTPFSTCSTYGKSCVHANCASNAVVLGVVEVVADVVAVVLVVRLDVGVDVAVGVAVVVNVMVAVAV